MLAMMKSRKKQREAERLQSDSPGNQLDSTSSKGSPALKSPVCVLSSVGRSLSSVSPSSSLGLVKDRPGRRKRDAACTSILINHFEPLTTPTKKTELLNQVMQGVMGTERYDELKLAQACFASLQKFMAQIQLEKKTGVETTPRNIVEGAMLSTLPAKEDNLDRAYGRAIGLDPRAFSKVRARRDDPNSFCRSINLFEKKDRGASKNLRPAKDHAYEFWKRHANPRMLGSGVQCKVCIDYVLMIMMF
jgi:hypothetical protein